MPLGSSTTGEIVSMVTEKGKAQGGGGDTKSERNEISME